MNTRLIRYLRDARRTVAQGQAKRFVLGNEAADLDSMASAVGYGYHVSGTASGSGPGFVPLVNAPRADYKLRTEAAFLFASVGIEPELLSFIDELDLAALHAQGGLELILVDHNVLAPDQAGLADAVLGVIDHHKDEGGFRNAPVRVIEPVGSSATLVAEALLASGPSAIEPDLAELLLGAILLDTVNLDPEAQRATPKDSAMARRLQIICGADRNTLFARLQFEKFNVASLGTADLLRKDYKEYKLGERRCGIASVLLPAARWLEKDPALETSMANFAAARGLDLLLAMNAYTDPEFRRDLVVWAGEKALRDKVLGRLEASELGLAPLAGAPSRGGLAVYSQANPAWSRKKLQPLLPDLVA